MARGAATGVTLRIAPFMVIGVVEGIFFGATPGVGWAGMASAGAGVVPGVTLMVPPLYVPPIGALMTPPPQPPLAQPPPHPLPHVLPQPQGCSQHSFFDFRD